MVTGAAGFIGNKVSEMLLEEGYNVIGVDNLNDYYDIQLKLWCLYNIKKNDSFKFYQIDIENYNFLRKIFQIHQLGTVTNLAA